MELFALLIVGIVIYNAWKVANASKKKPKRPPVRPVAVEPVPAPDYVPAQPTVQPSVQSSVQPPPLQPQVAVSMDSRLRDATSPLNGDADHRHPAAAGPVRAEYVPSSGSLSVDAASEGCEELRNIRYVRVERPRSVEQVRMDPHDIVRGILWSEVLNGRGGRRKL